ncbi:hypothetical protein ACFQZE_00675 [Paenibacillus sp. GCM10027627]|uniref:hypothetical protein n=1 Tax=unclassified Paenibacillus TaxID=185978 RepID=UPI0036433FDA
MVGCIYEVSPGNYTVNACCTTELCEVRTLPNGSTQNLYWLKGTVWFHTGGGWGGGTGANEDEVLSCVCTN